MAMDAAGWQNVTLHKTMLCIPTLWQYTNKLTLQFPHVFVHTLLLEGDAWSA